jgi:hypothetical protein
MRKGTWQALVVVFLGAVAAFWAARAQQAGGVDELKARSGKDEAYLAAYASEPGGTREENLWEVLVLMGVGDAQPAAWDGSLSVSAGEIQRIEGYRFELPDRILPQGGWEVTTKIENVLTASPIEGAGKPNLQLLPKGLLIRGAGSPSTSISIRSRQGNWSFLPMRIAFGESERYLQGRVEVKRIPPATDLSGTELRQHDFPSIAAGRDGTLWAVWSSYHDRQEELNLRRWKDGQWTRLIPVARAAADLWRPQVAVAGDNRPWLIWSQQTAGNWDIYAMPWEDNRWGDLVRLSDSPLPDIEPHVTAAADGTIYVVWQALEGRFSHIRMRYLKAGKWSAPVAVTSGDFDDWAPAVAAGSDGAVWIAWDRYTTSYDVVCRRYAAASGLGPEMKVAATDRFEAYASVAVDRHNRPWIAWETGSANWGKDLGAALGDKAPGTPLGGPRRIEVACLDNRIWKTPAEFRPADSLATGATGESDPLLFSDPNGSTWMAFKRRYSRAAYRPSVFWETYLTRLDGAHWAEPIPLAESWTRKSTRMGLAALGDRLWAFWPSESREYAFASRPHAARVMAGSVLIPKKSEEPVLAEYKPEATPARAPMPPGEAADVAAIRRYRVKTAGGTILRIVRGDLHRHTELSQDVGGLDDGSLPEFYRYMLDAASMDFGASTDHQGGGTDYWNFMTQKMTDMYLFPGRYISLYSYERNMGNPDGHRNIIHTRRNYSIVPFFQRIDPKFMLPDTPDGELLTFNSMSFGGAIANDTKLLYESLRHSGGIAIPHTSATNTMGTDWRDNDPKLDPVLEIYQGARQNYEAKNAPRGIRDGEESKALGGFQEAGLVWNAWKKGYRIGVIASSDHYSTHIAYAMVYTPEATRQAIFDAIKKRHTYGATDNIILEFRLGDRFMGDDFTATTPQAIHVKVRGTGVIEAIHLIRDAKYVYKVAPGKQEAAFDFMDPAAGPGQHWYYVRVEQRNGELAWSSPIWVEYR